MSKTEMEQVEAKLDELIGLCSRLEQENATLRAKEDSWHQERLRLLEKNDIARKRVEAMIERLKKIHTEA